MSQIVDTILVGPFLGAYTAVVGQVGALGKDEKPHGVQERRACHGPLVRGGELTQTVLEALLVLCPFPRKEDEAVKHHAGAEDGDVLDGLLEDDVEVAVHLGGVGDPPEVDPVGIYLVVCDQDEALGEQALEPPVFGLLQLASDGLVPADPDLDGGPPVGHGGDEDTKLLLGHGHPCVEVVLAVEVERRADGLGDGDAEGGGQRPAEVCVSRR